MGTLGGGVAPAIAQRPAPPEQQIIGGTAPNRAWPAQGYLQIAPDRACAGTLVSGRWFLTAGHCVSDKETKTILLPASAFVVNLGESDVTQFGGPERFAVDLPPVRHELYARRSISSNYDLALLHLARPTPAEPRFEPMRLVAASETGLWSPGIVATIIGWGHTESGAPTAQLRQAGVPIASDSSCESAYSSSLDPFVAATMLCAGDGTSDTCQGDSGGPLMVPRVDEFALAGITSYGIGCADPAFPGVYVRAGAAALNDWIRARVPTAAIAVPPQAPDPGDDVTLTASAATPPSQPGQPTYNWDLDDDGRFDDDTGTTAALSNIDAGSSAVRVEASYPDGDRALAREVITTAGSPLPQPPPPPPPPPKPVPAVAPTEAEAPAPPAPPAPATASSVPAEAPSSAVVPALARLLPGSRIVRIRGLLDRRMSIGVACTAACRLSGRLTLDGRTARALRLNRTGAAAVLGSGRRRLTGARRVQLQIVLTKKAVRALRRAKRGSLRVRVTATAGTRSQRLERALQLRR